MTVKYDMLGLLIYSAMVGYVLGGLCLATRYLPRKYHAVRWGVYPHVFVTRLSKVGWFFYAIGFVLCVAAMICRAVEVGHIPLQSMFEVMLFIGAAMFPLSVFSRAFLRVGGESADAFIAAAILVPAGFVFPASAGQLPPALQSPFFGPHVAVYLLAYAVMTKAAGQAFMLLIASGEQGASAECVRQCRVRATDRMVRLGFPLLTAGLLLGAMWGKQAWGDYWNWDPKELWSLATWLVFAGYFHVRSLLPTRRKLSAAVVIAGFVLIIITLLWVNLSHLFPGLHNYAA